MPKILLCGNDKKLIADLFNAENEYQSLEFMTTSEITVDIKKHLEIFSPYAFVLCAKDQNEESLKQVSGAMKTVNASGAKFIMIGTERELDRMFPWFTVDESSQMISKEVGFDGILDRLMTLDGSPSKRKRADATSTDKNNPASAKLTNDVDLNVSKKKKILIVDDDVNMLRTLNFALQDNYTVAVASAGSVALKFLEQNKVDLILLDYVMPGMDGETVLKHIRDSLATCRVPVIFLTGVSDKAKIQKIITGNVQGYLLKPVDTDKLNDAITRALVKG